jgi:hypothetical protein
MRPWFLAFLFTQIVEVPIHEAALARASRRRPLWARLLLAFGASAWTHPIVWFVFPKLVDRYLTMVVAAELFAWLGEASYLHLLGVRRAWAWSLLANGASLGLGLASRAIFGSP